MGRSWHSLAIASVILLNQVVVLAVDEEPQIATGCSIDASVEALRGLNKAAPTLADLDVLDRSWVVYKKRRMRRVEACEAP